MANDKIEPKITLDSEDRASYQRDRKSGASSGTGSAPITATTTNKSGNSLWLFVVLLIAVGGYGASYWLYQQSQLQLAIIENSQDRISDLERQLSATGEEMGESAVALQVKVTNLSEKTERLWSEMDKLWASAWRRNQTEIKKLNGQLTKQQRQTTDSFKASEQQIKLAQGQNGKLVNSLNALKKDISEQAAQVRDLKETMLMNQADSLQAETQMTAVKELLDKLEQQQKSLQQKLNQLSPKVSNSKTNTSNSTSNSQLTS